MKYLLILFLIGCASPKNTILASTIHSQENWKSFNLSPEVKADTRTGIEFNFNTTNVTIGRFGSHYAHTRLQEIVVPDVVRRDYGITFTRWFKELFTI